MKKHWQTYLPIIICVILFFLPFFGSGAYSVGGDDARLYYLYPGVFEELSF